MQAVQISRFGGSHVLTFTDLPTPKPATGQVLVRIQFAGVNFIDIYQRTGLYKNPLPFVPGMEAAGVVEDVGLNVIEFAVGDRVAFAMHPGAYAEYVCVPWQKLVKIPDFIVAEQAAAGMLQGLTAHYLAHDAYPLQMGDLALVHAAAGGTGGLLVQMAKIRGSRVIATVSSAEKEQRARSLGADWVIQYTATDFAAKVKELTNGKGVDVVYDSVGVDTFTKSLTCLRPRGYLVLYGQSSGPVAPVDPGVLAGMGSLFLTRPSLTHYISRREELLKRANDVFAWLKQKRLLVTIAKKFPLEKAAEAQEALASRRYAGKILLQVIR
ncbi:MAG: Quinone oxidoreductase 1 [bacterium ADurb.Bin478]|nr:MAG: Quinone oxidoreductase 1 [bacterium ADurb.Bin478]